MRNSTEISWEATKERLSEAERSLKNAGHELAAYKKAKAENDERFQIAAAVAESELAEAQDQLETVDALAESAVKGYKSERDAARDNWHAAETDAAAVMLERDDALEANTELHVKAEAKLTAIEALVASHALYVSVERLEAVLEK